MSEQFPNAQPIEQEAQTPAAGITFEQFEHGQKVIPDKLIIDSMNSDLEIVPGEKAYFLKSYLDQVPADTSDAEFVSNPDKVCEVRGQLNDFVADKLKIVAPPGVLDDKTAGILEKKKEEFVEKLHEDKKVISDFVHETYAGGRPEAPLGAVDLHGFTVELSGGKQVDFMTDSKAGVRANIKVQREASGLFVHYSSDKYLEERVKGNEPELTKRIYLNPKIEAGVDVFDKIVTAADAAGISMKGKILDRTHEATRGDREKQAGEFGLRGDGIVLYAGEDCDELLSLVEAIYKDNPDAFEGRKTSRIPTKIGEGVAIGDEPDSGESLTTHRAQLIQEATEEARKQIEVPLGQKIGPDQQTAAIIAFRQVFKEKAIAAGVNPENLAFNLPKAA